MCSVLLALTATSAVAGVVGTVFQGIAAKQQGKYQAQVARNNEILAQRAADREREVGVQQSQDVRRQARLLAGSQKALLSGHGIDIGSPTAGDVLSDTARFGEADALTVLDNANRRAATFEAQGANFNAQAALSESAGNNALGGSILGGIGEAAKGITSVAEKWQPKQPIRGTGLGTVSYST